MCILPKNHKEYQIALGRTSRTVLRPQEGPRALSALSERAGAGRSARLRRYRRQRAPQYRLQHDGDAEPDRGDAHPPDQARQDLRLGHAAEPRISEPPGRGIRHARRHVGRAARDRVPARHRHGILGPPDQSGDLTRALPRVGRHHPAGLDRRRADQLSRRILQLSLSSTSGRGRMQKPHPPCYIVGTGSPETIEFAAEHGFGYASVFVTRKRRSSPTSCARSRAALRSHHGIDQFRWSRPGSMSASRRSRRAGIYRAYPLLLRGRDAHHAAFSGPPGYLSTEQFNVRAPVPTRCMASSTWKASTEAIPRRGRHAGSGGRKLVEWVRRRTARVWSTASSTSVTCRIGRR